MKYYSTIELNKILYTSTKLYQKHLEFFYNAAESFDDSQKKQFDNTAVESTTP